MNIGIYLIKQKKSRNILTGLGFNNFFYKYLNKFKN